MSEPVYSFVYSASDARRSFKGVEDLRVVLGTLARFPPPPGSDDCQVYLGEAPEGSDDLVCVGIAGPGAEAVQRALVEAFEAMDVTVEQVFEGGPDVETPVATSRGGRWTRD